MKSGIAGQRRPLNQNEGTLDGVMEMKGVLLRYQVREGQGIEGLFGRRTGKVEVPGSRSGWEEGV